MGWTTQPTRGWNAGLTGPLAGPQLYCSTSPPACETLDLLRELLEETSALQPESRQDVEARLVDTLVNATRLSLKQLGSGGGNASSTKVLCKFLAGVAGKESTGVVVSPADANVAAESARRANPADDDVLSWTLWLRCMADPTQINRELTGILEQQGSIMHLRAALWSVTSLSKCGRLPAPAELPPLILRAMVGPHSGDDEVQFRAAQALATLIGNGGCGVQADPAMVQTALETALMRESQGAAANSGVLEKLLRVSSRFQRLHGHICMLSSPAFAGHPDRLKKLLYDIGNGSSKYLPYEPAEVLQSKAVPAVICVLRASTGEVQELALSALRCLLTSAATLGVDAEETLVEGAGAVIQVISSSAHAADIENISDYFRDAFGTLYVLTETRLPSVMNQLRTRQEVIAAALQARLRVEDAGFTELVQACKLIAVLTSVRQLFDELVTKTLPNRVVRAACYSIGEGDFDDDDLRPCADCIVKVSLQLLEQYQAAGPEAQSWELTAMASSLGVAGRYFDQMADAGTGELAISGIRGLLVLLRRGSDPATDSHSLLHYASWALSETATSSLRAREWMANHQETLPAIEQTVLTLLRNGNGMSAPADTMGSEARNALFHIFTVLALLQGAGPMIHAMGQHPQNAAVQAAGSTALRALAQTGGLQLPADNAVMALRHACAACAGNPEVETPACMALGLIMGAR